MAGRSKDGDGMDYENGWGMTMLSLATLEEIDNKLQQLDAIIDSIMYKHYSPESFQNELDSIEALRNKIQENISEIEHSKW